jgi:Fic family protein
MIIDTDMIKISLKNQKILNIFLRQEFLRSSEILKALLEIGDKISLVTVKRELSKMAGLGLLIPEKSGRSRSYRISVLGRIFSSIDIHEYCSIEPDRRYGLKNYNFELLREIPVEIFDDDELEELEDATRGYKQRVADISATIQQKELERLVIELSWKSSKIEGNTYTLLDTEKLILEHKEASGHDKKEATMIINHKDAFYYIREHTEKFTTLTLKNLEELHAILVKNLNINVGLRKNLIGVTGSKYRPLDNVYQIKEAVEALSLTVSRLSSPYAKALMALLGISYIQPFEDGNKRTARLMANAILLAYECAPLSYRSIDENEYREAMLVFYELNSIIPFKFIFINQYEFAAKNYAVK